MKIMGAKGLGGLWAFAQRVTGILIRNNMFPQTMLQHLMLGQNIVVYLVKYLT